MKRFELCYKYDQGSRRCLNEWELENLLKRYGFRVVDKRITVLSDTPSEEWDEYYDLHIYMAPDKYFYDIEYDEEKLSSEDVDEFKHFVNKIYGELVTYTDKD